MSRPHTPSPGQSPDPSPSSSDAGVRPQSLPPQTRGSRPPAPPPHAGLSDPVKNEILHPACPALTAPAAPRCPMTGQTQVFGEGEPGGGGTGVCRGKDDTTGFQNDAARNDLERAKGAGGTATGPEGLERGRRSVPGPSLQTARWGAQAESPRAVVGGQGGRTPPPRLSRNDDTKTLLLLLSKLLISESFLLF